MKKISCFNKFKLWLKNISCTFRCSNCVVNKNDNSINIDLDGDGVDDIIIPV